MPAYFESGFLVDKPAWHGLGNVIPLERAKRMTVPEFIVAAGLDWNVVKVPLVVPNCEAFDMGDGNFAHIPQEARGKRAIDRFGVFRDSDWKFIGDVGAQYVPLQNSKAFGWFQPWLDAGEASLETAGSLYGGAVVWILARVNQDEDEIIPGDFVRRYILLSTSHDGSQATHCGFTDVRTVCANTLAAAKRSQASKLLRTKHTRNQGTALETIRKTMDLANQEFLATAEDFRKLARCRINRDDLVKYVKVVLEADEGTPEAPKPISTRMGNIIDRIVHLERNGKGAEMAAGTAWGGYNAVTEFLSYERGHNQETRLKSLWFGDGSRLNQRALTVALQLAS